MFKKIALAAAMAVSAAFATWDYYPVQEAGKGTVEGGLYYDTHNDWSQAGLKIGGRYTIIPNLEISVQSWGYQFWSEVDCDGCRNGGDGLRDLVLGGRYQIDPMISVFLDMNLPIGGDESTSDELSLYLGGQFSMPTSVQGLAFGTEAGLLWAFEKLGNSTWERGLELHLGGELKYTVPNIGITPYVGMQLKFKITENTWEACPDNAGKGCKNVEFGDDSSGEMQFTLWLGAAYAITPELSVKGQIIFRIGDQDEMGGDATGFYVAVDYNF